MTSQNIIQKGQRYSARSKEEFSTKYPTYLVGKPKVLDQICMTVLSNRKESVEAILMKDFSTNQIICQYEDLGVDLVFIPDTGGISLIEFDATYKAFFRTRAKSTCIMNHLIETFPDFSKKHPNLLFIIDTFGGAEMVRHVFTQGTIEITTPSVTFAVSEEKAVNLQFSSAYRKYLKYEAESEKGAMEDLLLDAIKEINPEFDESSISA